MNRADAAGLPADTAARADATFVTHVTWALECTPGMVTRVSPELVLADSGLPCDTFNFVCRARLADDRVRAAAIDAASYFSDCKRPFSWWVGPADQPPTLAAVLDDIGLERAESELAMALPLEALPERAPAVADLDVRRVRTKSELETLALLSASNWDPPDPHVRAFYQQTAAALLSADAPQWFYVGYVDGIPIATAEAVLRDQTVALFNISTRPAFRGRGIGSMMTWQPLRDARTAGCDLAVLQAAAAGVGVYRRLGFRPFGEVTEFKPRSL